MLVNKNKKECMNEITVYEKMNDPIHSIQVLGEAIAKSGMFGCEKVEQGTILALQCIAEKKAPLEMAKNYHLIGGKLSMRSDAMLAEYRKRGGKVKWTSFDDKKASGLWSYDGNEVELSYTIEEAKASGLIKSGSGWTKDPSAMLRARLISKAIRMLAPEVVVGVYTPEETEDFTNKKEIKVIEPEIIQDKLETLLESYEPHATKFFLEQNWIKEGQTYKEISEERRSNILKNPNPLIQKLRQIQDGVTS